VEQPPDDKAMRASDADREQVAEVLRAAAGDGRLTLAELQDRLEALYAARTYGELEPVVSDLPASTLPSAKGSAHSQASSVTARPASPDRVGGKPTTWVAKAVFGGIARRGQWVVPSELRVKAVFGGAKLDLREARLETDDVVMHVTAVFGGSASSFPTTSQPWSRALACSAASTTRRPRVSRRPARRSCGSPARRSSAG
jgi:hypothetical protein